jgi:hypothetical protein
MQIMTSGIWRDIGIEFQVSRIVEVAREPGWGSDHWPIQELVIFEAEIKIGRSEFVEPHDGV